MNDCKPWQLLCRWENKQAAETAVLTDTIPERITEMSRTQLIAIGGIGLAILWFLNR